MWNSSHRIPMDWQLYESFIQPKLQEDHHLTSRTKEGVGNLGKSCDPGEDAVQRKLSSPWKYPLASWEISQDRQGTSVAQRESGAGRTERDQRRQPWLPCCTSQPEMSTCWCGQPWVLNFRLQPTGPRKDLGWLCRDSLKGCLEPHPRDVQRMGPRFSTEAPYKPYSQHAKEWAQLCHYNL